MIMLRAISIKTQVRRLRYFQVMLKVLSIKGLPKKLLENKIVSWSLDNHDQFEKHIASTGEIVFSARKMHSQSFENYFQAALSLGLLIEQHGFIISTRSGEVISKFNDSKNLAAPTNSYQLSYIERIYFLYQIFSTDFDAFVTVLKMLHEGNNKLQEFYKESNYKKYYLKRLEAKISYISNSHRNKLLESIRRVNGWKNAERYTEDIVPSRLNWMLDLGLIDQQKYVMTRDYYLSLEGRRLFQYLPRVGESDFIDLESDWLQKLFFRFIGQAKPGNIRLRKWAKVADEQKKHIIIDALDVFMNRFNSYGIPRLSVEQTCLFISLYTIEKHSITLDAQEVLDWIGFEKKLGRYNIGYRGASRPGESYLIFTDGK